MTTGPSAEWRFSSGRQDRFSEPQSCDQERPLICGTARFPFQLRACRGGPHGLSRSCSARRRRSKVLDRSGRRTRSKLQPQPQQVAETQILIEEHLNEIRGAWRKHFPVEVTNVSPLGFLLFIGEPGSERRPFGRSRTSSFRVHTICIGRISISISLWSRLSTRADTP